MGKSAQTLRGIEARTTSIDAANLDRLLTLYGAGKHERDELMELCPIARARGWWASYRPPSGFGALLGLETEAESITAWSHFVWPGYLQTQAYARALWEVTTGFTGSTAGWERASEMQQRRSQVILDQHGPSVTVLVDESVPGRIVGSPEVTAEQIKYVLSLPITVMLVPAARVHPGVVSLGMMDIPLLGPVAYEEGIHDLQVSEDDASVEDIQSRADAIQRAALDSERTRALLAERVKDLQGD